MHIEDRHIPVPNKIRLLDALSETGLSEIAVGSFVGIVKLTHLTTTGCTFVSAKYHNILWLRRST
jgi:hypothetical protein